MAKTWNFIADIGGTNARFGLEDHATGRVETIFHYSVADHPQFIHALEEFLRDVGELENWSPLPSAACLAVACPVEGETVKFTNSPWNIDRLQVVQRLNGIRVDLLNDCAAVAHAVAELQPQDWWEIGAGAPLREFPTAILAPGTGLGVCALVPVGAGYQVVEGEGGHVDFAPVESQEAMVLEILGRRYGRVSVERLLSGAGIVNIYQAMAQLSNESAQHETPADIVHAALNNTDTLSVKSLEMFCRVLGSTAGNLALTLGAKGGVYIAGGIVPRFPEFLQQSGFRHRFAAKGRFKNYLSNIPTRVIVKKDLGLYGAKKKLNLSTM